MASGLDERPPDARHPPVDWSVSSEIDPPADRVDRVAFLARTLADELHRRLGSDGVTCVRVGIEAETEYGEQLIRFWRHEGALTDAAVADRVRWQLDGWLNGSAATRPSGGITRLALVPDELIAARGRQLGFWGGETEVDQRAVRVAARLQGQLGADAVLVPERDGGRHPNEQLRLVPAATVELTGRSLAPDPDAAPWPGALPAPSPTRVLSAPIPIDVLDIDGSLVTVTGRGCCRLRQLSWRHGQATRGRSVGGPVADRRTLVGSRSSHPSGPAPDHHRRRSGPPRRPGQRCLVDYRPVGLRPPECVCHLSLRRCRLSRHVATGRWRLP